MMAHSPKPRAPLALQGIVMGKILPFVNSVIYSHCHKDTINVPCLHMKGNRIYPTLIKQKTPITEAIILHSAFGKADN